MRKAKTPPDHYPGFTVLSFGTAYQLFQFTVQLLGVPTHGVFLFHVVSCYPRRLLSLVLGAMAREITHREANWRCGAALQLALLFVELSRQHPAASDRSAQRTDERLTTLRAEIYARPQDKWTLVLMARRVHFSPSRLSALYKGAFGTSPMEDVLAARTQKACTLLLNQGISIESVSRECGFESAAYFSRQFKSREGSAPRDWASQRLER
ncbi:hypothetical protein IAD21_00117 [Abditibacteriota bacterium]|nr:hypothetical protein IAD21_00117 [Abditibacteriota bacterium]